MDLLSLPYLSSELLYWKLFSVDLVKLDLCCPLVVILSSCPNPANPETLQLSKTKLKGGITIFIFLFICLIYIPTTVYPPSSPLTPSFNFSSALPSFTPTFI